jgi:bifunctional pyridoxal-dependent enzyme with beta-cystathionase and maltose regulon repressor activities
MPRKDIFNSATVESMLRVPNLQWHTNPPDVIPMWIAAPDFPLAPEIMKDALDRIEAATEKLG